MTLSPLCADASGAPAPPQISEIYAASRTSVYISWNAVPGAARYELERMAKSEPGFSPAASTKNTEFTDRGLAEGERYFYRVKAVGGDRSESFYSEAAGVTALYFAAPAMLEATATSDYSVELSWAADNDNEYSFEIWRYDDQYREWKLLDTADHGAYSYTDRKAGPGERYRYKIRARSAEYGGASGFSAETYAETIFLLAPYGLGQTAAGSAISLYWSYSGPSADRFFIERRSLNNMDWSRIATAGAGETSRAGLQAPPHSAWFFRVGAYSRALRSVAYSDPIQADNGFAIAIADTSYGTAADDYPPWDAGYGGNANGSLAAQGGGPDGAGLDSKAIKELAKKNIIRAQGNGIEGGTEPVTRAEFAAMLARALGLDGRPIGSFGDVKPDHPYYADVMRAARLGFAKPVTADLFYPDRIITREEMAIFVYDSLLSYGSPLPAHGAEALRPFPDAGGVPARIAPQLRSVFGERIMIGIGMPDGRIIGYALESDREQAALVVYRYMRWLAVNG